MLGINAKNNPEIISTTNMHSSAPANKLWCLHYCISPDCKKFPPPHPVKSILVWKAKMVRARVTAAVVPTAISTASTSYVVATIPSIKASNTGQQGLIIPRRSYTDIILPVNMKRQMKLPGLFLLTPGQQTRAMMQAKVTPILIQTSQLFTSSVTKLHSIENDK